MSTMSTASNLSNVSNATSTSKTSSQSRNEPRVSSVAGSTRTNSTRLTANSKQALRRNTRCQMVLKTEVVQDA